MIRVSSQRPCPGCNKTSWCSFFPDMSAVICMRVKSDKPTKNGGFIHRLHDSEWIPSLVRTVRRQQAHSKPDWREIHLKCKSAIRPEALGWLSNDLCISVDALQRFEVGYHDARNVYSMPMRRPDGSICGVKYRPRNGRKFCEAGSKSGIFFVPGALTREYLVIVEGCSDAMAIHDIDYESVIGRDNCTGNVSQIVTLLRRLRPRFVVIIPDHDHHGRGQAGAEALRQILTLHNHVELLELPEGINDVRNCVQTKENADWLQNRIGEFISTQYRKESTND